MSRTASAGLTAHLALETTTLATCWKATLTNGTVYGFTDHDNDLAVGGVTYAARSGYTPSAIATTAGLAVDNLEVMAAFNGAGLTESALKAGLWDYAEIEVFLVNWADLTQGTLKQRKGWLGEVSIERGQFAAEMRGLTQALSQQVLELYSPTCRAKLGDARCGVNLAGYTVTGTLTSASSRLAFADTGRAEADDYFNYAQITFTSGANNGLKMEVKDFANAGGAFTLALPMPYDLAAGDTYSVHAGCDRILSTCINTFANAINFRGEPYLPGQGKTQKFGGQT